MKLLYKLLITAVSVIILAYLLSGVQIDNYTTALIVAFVLGVLRLIVRPLLILFTLPITIITLGIFLLFINAFIILMADRLIAGFSVDGIWWAILFSILLSIIQCLFMGLVKEK